jgi:hypothetical protein
LNIEKDPALHAVVVAALDELARLVVWW